MSIWPWNWPQEIADSVTSTIISVSVGIFVAIVGLMFIAGTIPTPFGRIPTFVIGGVAFAFGIILALGVL